MPTRISEDVRRTEVNSCKQQRVIVSRLQTHPWPSWDTLSLFNRFAQSAGPCSRPRAKAGAGAQSHRKSKGHSRTQKLSPISCSSNSMLNIQNPWSVIWQCPRSLVTIFRFQHAFYLPFVVESLFFCTKNTRGDSRHFSLSKSRLSFLSLVSPCFLCLK